MILFGFLIPRDVFWKSNKFNSWMISQGINSVEKRAYGELSHQVNYYVCNDHVHLF